jgi:type IV secretory pathway VirB4 component
MNDRDLYIQRVYDGRTYRSIGEEHGLTEQQAYQAVMREKRRQRRLMPLYPDGQIQDPDGIGEFEDEWTVEDMYKNMFDTVYDS